MTMTTGALVLWIALLVIIVLVIVPLAVTLLQRALMASRNIEAYLADMLAAGIGIARHTAAVPALDTTIKVAAAMQPVARGIEAKTGAVAALLASRAG